MGKTRKASFPVRLLVLLVEQVHRSAQAALTLEEALSELVDQTENGEQVVDAATPVLGLRLVGVGAEGIGGEALLALPQRVQDRIDLAPLALGGDQGEHLPDIAERLVVVAAIPALVDRTHQAPLD